MAKPDNEYTLAPAFQRPWQLWLFLGFIAYFMLLPALPKPEWMDRSKLYLAFEGRRGSFGYLANNIMQESSDIDILFLGHSALETDINPLIVSAALKPILGRDPVIKLIGHNGDALDYEYIAFQDIIARRKVKLLIWERKFESTRKTPNKHAQFLWDFGLHKPALSNLRSSQQVAVYLFNTMNGLRLTLSPFRSRYESVGIYLCLNQEKFLGACRRWQDHEDLREKKFIVPRIPANRLIHYRGRSRQLTEKGQYTAYDKVFSDAIFRLAEQHGTKVALIQVPSRGSKLNENIVVPVLTPDQPGYHTPILGAKMKNIFPGLTMDEIHRDYYLKDYLHLHYAAADYYTRAMLPGILRLYKRMIIEENKAP